MSGIESNHDFSTDVERCKLTLGNLEQLLDSATQPTDPKTSLTMKKNFILESCAIKSAHAGLQSRKAMAKEQFVRSTIIPYNQKQSRLLRFDGELKALQKQLTFLKKVMYLPNISFTPDVVLAVSDGKYTHLVKDKAVPISLLQIYSLSPESELPKPVYSEFQQLVRLEARKRILLQIKYDLLSQAKTQLLHTKRQWATRDSQLSSFVKRDLQRVLKGIASVRSDEAQQDESFKSTTENPLISGCGLDDEMVTENINEEQTGEIP